NVEYQKWASMSDQQRAGALDIAAGHESEADLQARTTKIAESLTSSGKFTDPGDAFQAAKVYATGGMLPPALQAKMKQHTFSELNESAGMAANLIQLGVPADRVGSVTRAAMAGGLENALPKGLKPIALQGLQIEREKLGLEQLRYQRENE